MSTTIATNLDPTYLETIVQLYPEEMREPTLWLAQYLIRDCNRNVNVLEEKVKALKYPTVASSFIKVFRGRWNRDASGQACSPCINQKAFIEMVDRLKDQSRLAALSGTVPFIETSTTRMIFDYIDERRAPGCVNKFGLIIGATGSQKTATMTQYQRINGKALDQCRVLEAGARPSLSAFINELAAEYHVGGRRGAAKNKMELVENKITHVHTIILENIQRVYREGTSDQPIFGWLQKLQDQKHCTIILTATPDFKDTFTNGVDKGYFEQFVGRVGGQSEFLILPSYAPVEDVEAIAQAFGLQDVEKHLAYLEKISREPGRIRILFGALQKAKTRSEFLKEALTIDHIKAVRGED